MAAQYDGSATFHFQNRKVVAYSVERLIEGEAVTFTFDLPTPRNTIAEALTEIEQFERAIATAVESGEIEFAECIRRHVVIPHELGFADPSLAGKRGKRYRTAKKLASDIQQRCVELGGEVVGGDEEVIDNTDGGFMHVAFTVQFATPGEFEHFEKDTLETWGMYGVHLIETPEAMLSRLEENETEQ